MAVLRCERASVPSDRVTLAPHGELDVYGSCHRVPSNTESGVVDRFVHLIQYVAVLYKLFCAHCIVDIGGLVETSVVIWVRRATSTPATVERGQRRKI